MDYHARNVRIANAFVFAGGYGFAVQQLQRGFCHVFNVRIKLVYQFRAALHAASAVGSFYFLPLAGHAHQRTA